MSADGSTAISLTDRNGRSLSAEDSNAWDVIAATPTDNGYQVLMEGDEHLAGKYYLWTADASGMFTVGSGWKTADQSAELGYEVTFGLDLNDDGVLLL